MEKNPEWHPQDPTTCCDFSRNNGCCLFETHGDQLSRPAPGRDYSCCSGIPGFGIGRGQGRGKLF